MFKDCSKFLGPKMNMKVAYCSMPRTIPVAVYNTGPQEYKSVRGWSFTNSNTAKQRWTNLISDVLTLNTAFKWLKTTYCWLQSEYISVFEQTNYDFGWLIHENSLHFGQNLHENPHFLAKSSRKPPFFGKNAKYDKNFLIKKKYQTFF